MADLLPGGTVTFLFSDVEGSTRLLEQLEFPPLKATPPKKTGADALAEEIERRVHEQVLAGFEPGSTDESMSKLVQLVLVGFLALFLSLAAIAAIVLLVRAAI